MRAWWKKGLIGGSSVLLLGSVLALTAGTGPAAGQTATSFTITANDSSSSAVLFGSSATLAETGLPSDATGTVTFSDSLDATLCVVTLPDTNCSTSMSLAPGVYIVGASYSGDSNYDPSSASSDVSLTVLAPTTTVASVSPTSVTSGALVTYTATVTSSYGSPSGTVNFRAVPHFLCSATITDGVASCSTTDAPIGNLTIKAGYQGDALFEGSNADTSLTVLRATPSLTCARLVGRATTQIKLTACTPFSAQDRQAIGPGSFLVSGGTLTWHHSLQTTIVTLTSTSPGQGSCPRRYVEHDVSGDVSGGTAADTLVGDPVSIRYCQSSRSGAVRLVTGTTAQL
jgi:large repetitive protein